MQPGAVAGAVYEFHASRARMGTRPGVNDPLTTEAFDTSGSGNHGTLTGFTPTVLPAGTNYFTNPSLEIEGTEAGIAAGFATNPLAGTTTKTFVFPIGSGLQSQRVQYTGVAGDSSAALGYYTSSPVTGLSAADPVTVSMLLKGSVSGCAVRLIIFDQGWATIATQAITLSGTATRWSVSGVCPAGLWGLNISLECYGIDNGDTYDITIDDVLVEKAAALTAYFDGSTNEHCAWTGATNASTSTRESYLSSGGWDGTGTLADPHRLVFDGTNYVGLPAIGARDDKTFTYEAWVKTSTAAWNLLVTEFGSGRSTLSASAEASLIVWPDGMGTPDVVTGTTSVIDGQWHHLVGTGDGTLLHLFVDGEEEGTPTTFTGTTSTSATIGEGWSQTLFGDIAVARIYPFALSAEHVATNYAAGYLWTPNAARLPLQAQRPPITIECAGLLARAKRRQDYCRVWTDLDMGQWHEPDTTTVWTPGIAIQRSGFLQFAAASSSIFPASSYQALDYHLHGGLSTEQDIYGVSFEWTSLGTMKLRVYETALPDSAASWNELGEYGGATNASPDTVDLTCAAGMRGLRIEVGYDGGTTLSSGDEWLKIGNLRVHGQSGSATIGEALADILVDTGLATSYSSVSVV